MLGLDPDPRALWPVAQALGSVASSPAQAAAGAFLAHCTALIDAAAPACVAVKPQLARFELLGAAGWATLEAVVAYEQSVGLLVIVALFFDGLRSRL